MTLQPRVGRAAGAAAAALLLTAAPATAQPLPSRVATDRHVTVEIVTDTDRPRAGAQWLGLRFTMEPGWHIYWLNPGDGGGPPEASWQTVPGMQASPFEWPLPERIDANGLVNYGYHGTIVLPVRLAMAADLPAARPVVRADVRWLACKEMCVSGRGTVELRWPLAGADRARVPEWAAAIAAARARVPQKAPPSWAASATSGPEAFTIDIRTGRREAAAVFFPLEVSQVDDSARQVVAPLPDGVRLQLRKSAQLIQDPVNIPGIVSFPDGRAFEVSARVAR